MFLNHLCVDGIQYYVKSQLKNVAVITFTLETYLIPLVFLWSMWIDVVV